MEAGMSDPQEPVVQPEPVGYSQPRPVAVRPKKTWLAVVLAVLLGPFGFFYVIRWYWALLIVLAELAIGFALPSGGAATSIPLLFLVVNVGACVFLVQRHNDAATAANAAMDESAGSAW
jgi:hypothetical protein